MISLVFLLISFVQGHNWVASTARARGIASTVGPCQSRRGDVPHVQVAKNQDFIIEWATGHAATAYFVVIKSEDEVHLRGLAHAVMDQYIDEAPAGSDTVPPPRFQKFHRKKPTTDPLDNVRSGGTDKSFFHAAIVEGMPEHRSATPPVATKGMDSVVAYKPTAMSRDRRVQYTNPKWPFILAIHRYSQVADQPGEVDYTNFEIPGNPDEPGKYIVWYYWHAYRDCIDVEYAGAMPAPIANPYGVLSDTISWQRIDHCTFPDQTQIMTDCIEVISDLRECIWGCRDGRYCGGIIVGPIENPDTVDPLFKDLHGLPFGELEPRDMAGKTRETPKMMCDPADFAAVADKRNTQVCVGVRTRTATSTFDVYETTDDPASPFYYTTCYLPAKHIQFDNLPPPADKVITNWREPHSSVCMDCKNAAYNSWVTVRPVWQPADVCVNCESPDELDPNSVAKPIKEEDLTLPWSLVKTNQACDGSEFSQCSGGNYGFCEKYADSANADTCPEAGDELSCFKILTPINAIRHPTTHAECVAITSRDSECTKDVFWSPRTNQCLCYRNRSCCKPCSPTYERYLDHYNLD